MSNYAPVSLDESVHVAQSGTRAGGEEGAVQVKLTVLHKEKKVPIMVGSLEWSVKELKAAIFAVTDVAPERQRILVSGKLLKPDSLSLAAFKVTPGAILHLFPTLAPAPPPHQQGGIPAMAVAIPLTDPVGNPIHVQRVALHDSSSAQNATQTSHISQATTSSSIAFINGVSDTGNAGPEDAVAACSERVRFFSRLLLVLCYLSIFATSVVFINEGGVGKTTLESTVTLLDFFISLCGVHVGRLGLAAAPVDAQPSGEIIKEYCRKLGYLTAGAVVLRCLWVLDIVEQVRTDVAESKVAAIAGTPRLDPLTGQEALPLTDDVIFTVGIQAVAFGLIIISVWLRCYVNSVALRLAVCPESRTRQAQEMRERSVRAPAEEV